MSRNTGRRIGGGEGVQACCFQGAPTGGTAVTTWTEMEQEAANGAGQSRHSALTYI